MKTFLFYHNNSSAVITLSDETFEGADTQLFDLVNKANEWVCDDEEGESEE